VNPSPWRQAVDLANIQTRAAPQGRSMIAWRRYGLLEGIVSGLTQG